ncbi:hypothetical protein F4805DRAFT_472341 [Annulohypoxylon moriforme]|nr:hypothetical protein F4805DRAFT_472341 [Annulohypoxylon moriforme]
MSTTSPTVVQRVTSQPTSRFLALPYELRREIYELYLYSHLHGFIDDGTMVCPWDGWKSIKLLEVCKTIYEEASPIVYQEMSISCNLEQWRDFLTRIGPHNIAKLQRLTINYTCGPDFMGHCYGFPEKQEYEEVWADIIRLLKKPLANANLKALNIYVTPCTGCNVDSYHIMPGNVKFTQCRVYKDLEFLKSLSGLCCVQKMSLGYLFDPLWGSALRRKLGFIALYNGRNVMLVNPEHKHLIDWRKHKQSDRYHDVYEQVIEIEEPEQPDTSDNGEEDWPEFASTNDFDPFSDQW